METTFIDHLPDHAQGKRWSVWCPSEGYHEQEQFILSGAQNYLDLDLILEGTELQARLRVYLQASDLICDLKRPGLYRLLGLMGEFLTYDYFHTASYVRLRGYVELAVSNPDTVAGQVTLTYSDAPSQSLSA